MSAFKNDGIALSNHYSHSLQQHNPAGDASLTYQYPQVCLCYLLHRLLLLFQCEIRCLTAICGGTTRLISSLLLPKKLVKIKSPTITLHFDYSSLSPESW